MTRRKKLVYMRTEKTLDPTPEREPEIVIKKSTDAPPEIKANPFYDPEIWGRAYSPDDIYLPEADEAISFAIAAHEIGHLVEEGKRKDAGFDNFEATRAEEQRAWEKGWGYLKGYLAEYYQGSPDSIPLIEQAFTSIQELMMKATDLGKEMYLKKGELDGLEKEERDQIQKEKREQFFSKKGGEFKSIFEEIKKGKLGVKPDWERFVGVVTKAVEDIVKDNK